jgi:hypothetical protein
MHLVLSLSQEALNGAGKAAPADIAALETTLLHSRLRQLARPALGSAAFLAALECSWQLHEQ